MSGHNSHYVVTKRDGRPVDKPEENNIYDEIVIAQEYVYFC